MSETMGTSPRILFRSASAPERLEAARTFACGFAPSAQLVVVGHTREAADDFAREIAMRKAATFGLHRFSFAQFVSRLAQSGLGKASLSPATRLTIEAVMARVTFGLLESDSFRYFKPVARFPGFQVAAARTVTELRTAGLSPSAVGSVPRIGADLAELSDAFECALRKYALADRAELYRIATEEVRSGRASAFTSHPLILLDLDIRTSAEEKILSAMISAAPAVFATTPQADYRAAEMFTRMGLTTVSGSREAASSLGRLRSYVFSEGDLPDGIWDDTVVFFSAPGEGRECVEIARIILREAESGISFDEMAIVLRSPETYAAHIETAMRRAAIPVFIARGAERPSPTGRAFLALLACTAEDLSARRFAEYLSLGQVPPIPVKDAPPSNTWLPSEDDLLSAGRMEATAPEKEDADTIALGPPAPRRWERLLVEAAVVGGKARWARRLDGLIAQLTAQCEELSRTEPESPRIDRLKRDVAHIDQLKQFALPIIEALEELKTPLVWGQWLERLRALATKALRRPARVLKLLGELEPMADIGPVGIAEVRALLEERLVTLEKDQPERRWGRVFVSGIDQLRGRAFRIVFVPGLAERMFPKRVLDDPILPDEARQALPLGLPTQQERLHSERLLLHVAAGGVSERLYLSYPRLETGAQGRARVPSFYGLDVVRAIRGRLPHYRDLERATFEMTKARLGWPAPTDPSLAIDSLEYDLAVLHPLLHGGRSIDVRGRARFLMDLSPSLGRSLRAQWQRWSDGWTTADGLVHPNADVRALLAGHRLTQRPYSVSALQRFAACPYKFFLSGVYRLAPREETDPLISMDPLTRGQILHRILADVLSELRRRGELPVTPANLNVVETLALEIVDRVSVEYAEKLAPAIRRIWDSDIDTMRTDVRLWVRHMAETTDEWVPRYFELSFGLSADVDRDPASLSDPVAIGSKGWLLHGSIDLIEEQKGALRITDYKTGRNTTNHGLVVGGGEVLQPVLYSLATEKMLGAAVKEGRLFFSTLRGGFSDRIVPLQDRTRKIAETILSMIDSSIEDGFLPPAPRDKACQGCDFRPLCGPAEERRFALKPHNLPILLTLARVRNMK